MAYNHGREDRKWRIWKEAEEKLMRECGVEAGGSGYGCGVTGRD